MKRKNRLPLNEKIALWVYGNDPQLINSPTRRDQSRLTIEAVIGVCGLTLIQGNFLQGLLIYLGATDGVLSLVSVLGLIAGAAAIFGGYIFQGREYFFLTCCSGQTHQRFPPTHILPSFRRYWNQR